jgi:uncharacterized membrane protein
MDLQSSKNLGGIGAILLFLGPLFSILSSFAGLSFGLGYGAPVAELIGVILVLVALKGFADFYKESGIFNNALYGFIVAIVGGVVAVVVIIYAAVGLLGALGLSLSSIISTGTVPTITASNVNFNTIAPFVATVLAGLLILVVFAIITAILVRKSLGQMSTKTGIGLFGTSGLILLIGAVLTIIGIGVIIIWISFLLLAIAFFNIKPQPIQTQLTSQTPPPMPPPT